ncbi:hypothetical protein PMZ80_003655 [Knufia obscura]|uniref:F-box domain-containing protein n=2 Tax=Knufia TaxID=430999 RepID=A0AAN8ISQ6_9EURO|nr:hypothetical protein PMZ80_003655 [Knufia obscura]KAK5958432.1 hypothetical protein OHC33_000275 [Knufia fluminis]
MPRITDLPDEILLQIIQRLYDLHGNDIFAFSLCTVATTNRQFLRLTYEMYWQESKGACSSLDDPKSYEGSRKLMYNAWKLHIKSKRTA